jgi:hypothetical protein
MTLPSSDLTTLQLAFEAGRAVFLLFSFIFAAITFTAWRRATRAQTEQVLSHTNSHPARQGRRLPRGPDVGLWPVARRGGVGATPARLPQRTAPLSIKHNVSRGANGTTSYFRNASSRGARQKPILTDAADLMRFDSHCHE